jgi:purine-binding chemotaxis protein CheW
VINVRGAVVPVVDLGVKFGGAGVLDSRRTCVLVVETAKDGEALTLGVLADAVNEVIDLGAAEIEPPPSFGTGLRLDHVTGMGKLARGFVVLLDIDRVLSASEAELAAAAAEAAVQAREAAAAAA